MESIEKAKMLAECLHAKQKYGEHDYFYHLEKTWEVLYRFHSNETMNWDYELMAAAYLHDCVEDTQMKLPLIGKYFGEDIQNLVFKVTNEVGANRKERNLKTYQKLRGDHRATRLKLADRIANVEYSLSVKSDMFTMYKKENPSFESFLRQPPHNDDMWDHLNLLFGE